MQVEGEVQCSLLLRAETGARVRNRYAICPIPRDSPLKGGLILYVNNLGIRII